MKKLSPLQKKLIRADTLISQLPLDSGQRASVAETLAKQDDAVVDHFLKTAGESLDELTRLNAQISGLRSNLKISLVTDHLPPLAVSGFKMAGLGQAASHTTD